MVREKAPKKLVIQASCVESEQQMTNLKLIESRYMDDKRSRVRADLKKKMKKSRSLKLSNVESLRSSSPLKMNILQGEPPPSMRATTTTSTPESAAVQPKQSIMKATTIESPHYMKSTTSFDARKEHSQMSPQTAKPASSDKSARQKNLRRPSSLADTSSAKRKRSSTSLKLVRTLTKTPNFKHTSLSARKYSKVAICTGVKSQQATCSSTLKDLKFPSYLMLTPGGTESEGISVMKVCPYTYCSLNGHFHTPLPPLRSFLSAKRSLLKANKIAKLEALPPRMNSTDEGSIETQAGMVVSNGKPASQDEDLDFFIEIYAKNNGTVVERSEGAVNDGYAQEIFYSTKILEDFDDYMFSAGDVDENIEVYIHEQQHEESLSDGSPHSEIDSEEVFDQKIDANFFCEELKDDISKDYTSFFTCEESTLNYIDNGSDEKELHSARSELTTTDLDAFHMEWEEGKFITSYLHNQGDDTTQTSDEIDLGHMQQSRHGDLESLDASNNKSDDTNNYFLETIADDAFEDSLSSEKKDYTSEIDGHNSHLASFTSTDGMNEEPTVFTDGNEVVSLIGDQIVNVDNQHEDDKTNCTSTKAYEVSKIDHQENEFQLDEDEHEPHKKHIIDKIDNNIDERIATQGMTDESDLPKIEAVETTPTIIASTEQELQLHGIKINQEQTNPCKNPKGTIRSKRSVKEWDEQRAFNPREPTYLPVKPDPEAEKIDLKHQPEDERKTAEEWMLDYALRQAVTKLAPARSRRVALLVEAFETVSPISKYEAHMKHFSAVLTRGRPLQTCI